MVRMSSVLGQHADLRAMQVIKGLHQILGRATPAGKLGDQDGLDLTRPGQRHDLLAFGAVVVGAGRRLLEHGNDLVT
jgi:hypothetical protein